MSRHAEAASVPVDAAVVAGVQLLVEALSLGLGEAREAREQAGQRGLAHRRVVTRARRCDPGALAERTGIGIPLLVSPEPGAVAESAGWPPVHDYNPRVGFAPARAR